MYHSPRTEELEALVEDIYQAGWGSIEWISVVDRITHMFMAKYPLLAISEFETGPALAVEDILVASFGPKIQSYLDYYQRIDIFPATHLSQAPDVFVTPNSVGIGERYKRTEFYNDFVLPIKSPYITAGYTHLDEGRFAVLALGRSSRGPFAPEEFEVLNTLLKHFRRSLMMWTRLQREKSACATLRASLDSLATGIAVVDKYAKISWLNRSMELLVRAGDFQVHNGVISPLRAGEASEFRRRVFQCANAQCFQNHASPSSTMVLAVSRDKRVPLVVEILPMRSLEFGIGGTLILVTDPVASLRNNPAWLRQAFNLSPTEVKLVSYLVDGLTLTEAAMAMEISRGTARNHLKRIFAKTSTNRQSELIAMLSRISAQP